MNEREELEQRIRDAEKKSNDGNKELYKATKDLENYKDKHNDHKCWMCKKEGATIKTEPQPPDNEIWWFHKDCYWKLQDILY